MALSKAFALALVAAAAVQATPISSPPSKVIARADPPKPSSYPLGDACTNEWQYLNFNREDDEGAEDGVPKG